MSLTVTNQQSERDQIVALRRQAVFMFIATHLDADGCFSGSDQYIANTVAGSNRKSVNRARQSLEKTGDVMVINTEDRYDAKGIKLPNLVRPVPVRTFWVREWIRGGSKTETRVHGEDASSSPGTESLNPKDLPSKAVAPVSTVETRGHDHKNSMLHKEQPYSYSVELQNATCSTHSGVHGSTKYTDPPVPRVDSPVQRALNIMRGDLERARGRLSKYGYPNIKAEVAKIEQEIAVLEGR